MSKIYFRLALLAAAVGMLLMSCNLTQAGQTDAGALYTQAAQTLSVQMTQQAFATLSARLTEVAQGVTPTSTPTLFSAPQSPIAPTATFAAPSATSALPTPRPATATAIPVRCNQISFVRDINIADGTVITAGADFTKTWRLQNSGSCTWDRDYSLVFVDGDRMSGDRRSSLDAIVDPGETVDVSIELTAPDTRGRYRGYWMLEDEDGNRFGFGARASDAFWVDVRVVAPNPNFAYDFAVNMCAADWTSSAGSLKCPSSTSDAAGSIAFLDRPELETGRTEDEPALWARPQTNRGGWIEGLYPAYKVKEGEHFVADVGCLAGNQNCAVTFTLDYVLSNGRVRNLGEWYEAYDGKATRIDVDLTPLAGQTVQFVLGVINEGRPERANAFWLVPSIRKAGAATATPSPTPTRTPTQVPPGTPTSTPTQIPGTEPTPSAPDSQSVVQAARIKVAQDLGANPESLEIMSAMSVIWQDSCLGISIQGQACAAVQTPGYRILIIYTDMYIEARTNQDGSLVMWFEP